MAESVIWTGRSSQLTNIKSFLVCLVIWILLIPTLWFLWEKLGAKWSLILTAVWFGLPFLFAAKQWLNVKFYVYELTSQRMRITKGILSKRTDELELYRVKDITLVQPFFMRLFKLGNVVLDTSDRTTPTVTVQAVRDPRHLLDELREAVETMRMQKRVREVDFSDGDMDGGDFSDMGD
ncbi:MAG: PH domain-containing protein [Planctomycetes bacterium]|nr:PH domain-containing protein [Planctomycetota bacterium]NOG56040.1 PH domain-containing protein [Planctomycetota bacterium]